MKKIMSIMAALALISVSVQAAGPKVEMKTSGPSGQGNLIWWAPSSGITNLVMTTNGVTYLYVEGGAILNSTAITNVLASGMVLPAVDYAAATNGAAGNIASGNLALARITNAAATVGSAIGGNIPVAAITNALTTGGASVGGNVPLAAITNALVTGTLAANLTGNIAVARITNAAATVGASIGGNIPIAALTNAAGGGLCVVTNLDLDGTTNIITFIGTVQRNQ